MVNFFYENLPLIEKIDINYLRDDIFICALGFEERCIGTAKKLAELGYKCKESIILKYDVHEDQNEINYDELKRLLSIITYNKIHECIYKTTDVNDFYFSNIGFKHIYDTLRYNNNIKRVSVDVSNFATGLVIQIIDFLLRSNINQMRILYTEAELYYPSNIPDSYKEEYLSSGLRDVITMPNFCGIHTPGYSPMYILFLGFEPIRVKGLIYRHQPSKKIGIYGIPSKEVLSWRLTMIRNMYRYYFKEEDEIIELPEFDYLKVLDKLYEIYDKYSQHNNITIVPMGSKMQTLAVVLFLENHPDVKLLITIPKKYDPLRYSEGIGDTHQISFNISKKISK